MSKPAARIGDMHTCPAQNPGPVPHVGGPVVSAAFNVITGGSPQGRVSDKCVCVGPPDVIVQGSGTVLVNNLPAARMGDMTAHGGVIVVGWPTVLIGDSGSGGGGGGGGGAGGGGSGGNVADFGFVAGIAQSADRPCLQAAAAAGAPFVRT